MATSLASQLLKLKVPQTAVLQDKKVKPSIIFDKKTAATKDVKTIFELGLSGFDDLILLNPTFSQFKQTLFDPSTIEFQRSMQDAVFNEKLDKTIKRFFYHLGPYLIINPAQLCLEWLIRRFQIHEYNIDDFIDLILPYHETKIFVKCLQIINLKNANSKWDWLVPTVKSGLPLSKTILQKRAAEDMVVFKAICSSTLNAIKALGIKCNYLQIKINFFSITTIGALEKAKKITESHLSSLISIIFKGLTSNFVDFTASSLMITGQLVMKAKLKKELLNTLLKKVLAIKHAALQNDIIILLIILVTQQNIDYPEIFSEYILTSDLISRINSVSADNVNVHKICIPLIKTCLQKIESGDKNLKIYNDFMLKLFEEIQFQKLEIKEIISEFLEWDHKTLKGFPENGVLEIDSDDDDDIYSKNKKFQEIYAYHLVLLEKKYPKYFNDVINEIMHNESNKIPEKRKQALKTIIDFRSKVINNDNDSILENFYHPNINYRILSIQHFIEQFDQIISTNECIAKNCLVDCLNSDNPNILIEILKLSTSKMLIILDSKSLLNLLLNAFDRFCVDRKKFSKMKYNILEHIFSPNLIKIFDSHMIILLFFPLLVSQDKKDHEFIENYIFKKQNEIIETTLIFKDLKFLKAEKLPIKFEELLAAIKDIAKPEPIVEEFEKNEKFYNNSERCSLLLLFLTRSYSEHCNTNVNYKIKGFEIFKFIHKNMKIVDNVDSQLKKFSMEISSTIVLNFLLSLLQNEKIESKNFRDSEISTLFNTVLEIYIEKLFLTSQKIQNKELANKFSSTLMKSMQHIFENPSKMLDYLAFFFIYDRIVDFNINYEFQIRVLKFFNYILTENSKMLFKMNNITILKIILGLSSSENIIRKLSIETLETIVKLYSDKIDENILVIIKTILESKRELIIDEIQIKIILYSICLTKTSNNKMTSLGCNFLESILNILDDANIQMFIKALLLKILKFVNEPRITDYLVRAGYNILEEYESKTVNNQSILDNHSQEIYKNIIERLDVDTIKTLKEDSRTWILIEKSVKCHNIFINSNGKIHSIAFLMINAFNDDLYLNLIDKLKEKFLLLVLEASCMDFNDSISNIGIKMIKKFKLDCQHLKIVFIQMKEIFSEVNSESVTQISAEHKTKCFNSIKWKMGILSLELLQNLKNLENFEVLNTILFDLLKKCLEFEEQGSLDYVVQLILSCLINLCMKVVENNKKEKPLVIDDNKIDLIVQSIRSTRNSQIHHHALMLLSKCASLTPQKIFHHLINIFTFMGSTVVRQDDSFTFQIIFNIVESVIPMIVDSHNSKLGKHNNRDKQVIPMLKVFSDIILDVPEHRKLILYSKVIETLGVKEYLWMFLCILFESHVSNTGKESESYKSISKDYNRRVDKNKDEIPIRVMIAVQICETFEPLNLMESSIMLIKFLRKLPLEKFTEKTEKISSMDLDICLFDVNSHSAKQLRHFKFTILQFISSLTSSAEFSNAIAKFSAEDSIAIKPYYQNFIIEILGLISHVTNTIEKKVDPSQQKYWKIILHYCTEVLDNIISLLTPDIFLLVIHGLLQHDLFVVRRRVMEILINKLQYKTSYFDEFNEKNLLMLLNPLKKIISLIPSQNTFDKNEPVMNEEIVIQHLALIALKLLSKKLAFKYFSEFKEILSLLTTILRKRKKISKIIIAATVLAISEVSSNLKAHSLANLHQFMPNIISVLNDLAEELTEETISLSEDNIVFAILTGVSRLFDSLPLLLGPYYENLFVSLLKIWVYVENHKSDNSTINIQSKLRSIWSRISTSIPLRILLPHCKKIYTNLLEGINHKGIIYFMNLLSETINNTSGNDINFLQAEIVDFYLAILDFRSTSTNENILLINEIENDMVKSFNSVIVKMSEVSFRPLCYKLYDWAIRSSKDAEDQFIDRIITYFNLLSKIAETLKSLFILFASDFIEDAAKLLKEHNYEKSESCNKPEKDKMLLEYIIKTLYFIFLHDTQGFINNYRFNVLMEPIVDQIENCLVIENESLQQCLLDCISQLMVVSNKDTLWQQLNYHLLLKCRNENTAVKICTLNSCIANAKKLGKDFSVLLPEMIPFIAELLENENQDVERLAKKVIQELEKVVGESLQKYF